MRLLASRKIALTHRTVPLLCGDGRVLARAAARWELARLPTAIPGRGGPPVLVGESTSAKAALPCRREHPKHLVRRTDLPPPKCVEALLKIHGRVRDRCGGLRAKMLTLMRGELTNRIET